MLRYFIGPVTRLLGSRCKLNIEQERPWTTCVDHGSGAGLVSHSPRLDHHNNGKQWRTRRRSHAHGCRNSLHTTTAGLVDTTAVATVAAAGYSCRPGYYHQCSLESNQKTFGQETLRQLRRRHFRLRAWLKPCVCLVCGESCYLALLKRESVRCQVQLVLMHV